jgi:nucleotide-binding universal stress UspA family protein
MKKILIALDYNPSAQIVAETGFALAKSMHAATVLIHVMENPAGYSAYGHSPIMGFDNTFIPMETLVPENFEAFKEGASSFLNKSKEHLGDDSIETMVEEGDTAETILRTATDIKADIVVIGSHSRRGLEKILMGSVAEKVMHHTTLPLFIIPTKG